MASSTVITVEIPQEDPVTASFSDDEVEQIDLSMYPFSKWNTEGTELAGPAMASALSLAREHPREDVRAWMREWCETVTRDTSLFEFEIDWDILICTAVREKRGKWEAIDEMVTETMDALTWSYQNAGIQVTEYALAALRCAILAVEPNVVSFHVDYTGDESGSMYVDYLTLKDGGTRELRNGWSQDTNEDPDGEIARAASDLRGMQGLSRTPGSGVIRVGTSDYNVLVFPDTDSAEDDS